MFVAELQRPRKGPHCTNQSREVTLLRRKKWEQSEGIIGRGRCLRDAHLTLRLEILQLQLHFFAIICRVPR